MNPHNLPIQSVYMFRWMCSVLFLKRPFHKEKNHLHLLKKLKLPDTIPAVSKSTRCPPQSFTVPSVPDTMHPISPFNPSDKALGRNVIFHLVLFEELFWIFAVHSSSTCRSASIRNTSNSSSFSFSLLIWPHPFFWHIPSWFCGGFDSNAPKHFW